MMSLVKHRPVIMTAEVVLCYWIVETFDKAFDLSVYCPETTGAGTFQKVVRLGLKNERSRREDRGAKGA